VEDKFQGSVKEVKETIPVGVSRTSTIFGKKTFPLNLL